MCILVVCVLYMCVHGHKLIFHEHVMSNFLPYRQATVYKTLIPACYAYKCIGAGGEGNRWSPITIRLGKYYLILVLGLLRYILLCIALAVYNIISPAAYRALQSFKILNRCKHAYIHYTLVSSLVSHI